MKLPLFNLVQTIVKAHRRLPPDCYIYLVRHLCIILISFIVAIPGVVYAKDFTTAPVPAWTTRVEPDLHQSGPVEQVSKGVFYLLSDSQIKIDRDDKTSFLHYAVKALNEEGLEQIGHVEIRFDPSYQSLTLHSINVHRGGKIIPKLGTATVRILQREKELEYRIYDGSKTANVFLDDIRVGDIVEYSYSLRGTNPVFQNKQFGSFDLQWGVPIKRLFNRLIVPKARDFHVTSRNTDTKPAILELNGEREYVWSGSDIPALIVASNAPSWYDPYPAVQWSEFEDWASVAQWAIPYYRIPKQLSPSLQAQVKKIADDNVSAEARMLATLRFVQSEIRYLGVEIGASSHAPAAPEVVFKRRFGDCKDKTMLTITMLDALGVRAQPALVNTTSRKGIKDLHPIPGAFNHVLVHVNLNDKIYWIDPTRSPQKGDITHLYQPNYDVSLVIDKATTALTPMPSSVVNLQKRLVRTVFDSTQGVGKPVNLTVTSVMDGGSAESIRNVLATENREDLQKKYLNFYARHYPGIVVRAPITVTEDENANRITVEEHYTVAGLWTRNDKAERQEAEFGIPDMETLFQRPDQPIRNAPLNTPRDIDLEVVTEIQLPKHWQIKTEQNKLADSVFTFEHQLKSVNSVVTMSDHFTSIGDHVAAKDTAAYIANQDKARASLGYTLYQYDQTAAALNNTKPSFISQFNWTIALLALLLISFWARLASKIYRNDFPLPPSTDGGLLKGFGGWLILPAISIVIAPFSMLSDLVHSLDIYGMDQWISFSTVGNTLYHPYRIPLLLFELIVNIGGFTFSTLLVVLFFKQRRSAPAVFIAFSLSMIIIQLLDMLLSAKIHQAAAVTMSKDWIALAKDTISGLLWSTYFLKSDRVRNTFTQLYKQVNSISEHQTLSIISQDSKTAPDESAIAQADSTASRSTGTL